MYVSSNEPREEEAEDGDEEDPFDYYAFLGWVSKAIRLFSPNEDQLRRREATTYIRIPKPLVPITRRRPIEVVHAVISF